MNKRASEKTYSLNYTFVSGILSSKMIVGLPVLGGVVHFAVIYQSDVKDLINYFCDKPNRMSVCEDFIISSLLKNVESKKILTFIDDKYGLRRAGLSELQNKFLTLSNDCEIFFDRRTMLLYIDWEYLLTKAGYLGEDCSQGLRLRILDKIKEVKNMSYPKYLEGIVELKYVARNIEYNKRLKPYKPDFKDSRTVEIAKPMTENIAKVKISQGKKVSRTALGSMIENYVISELKKGNAAKPMEVWNVIKSQNPPPDPITEIDKIKKIIHHYVPSTGNIEIMPYKTFQNRVNEYRDACSEKVKKIKNPAQFPSKRNIPDKFPPRG